MSLLAILAFVPMNLLSGRHVLPEMLIWPSPRTLSEMPQHLVHIQVETEAGKAVELTLRMRLRPLMGARYICGTGINS